MKIVVGFDGSPVSEQAIKVAGDHARVFNAKILLVTSMKGGQKLTLQDFENAEHELKRADRHFKVQKVACETRLLVRGLSPGEDLVQFSNENQADEIIIGVKRRSRAGKALFGSTAQYVILNAHCPVVTIK